MKTLSFNSIDAQIDTSVNPAPYQVVIGDANTPLKVQPSIYINTITNLVFDSSTNTTTIPTTPVTTPSVEFIVNGAIRNFDIVAATQGAVPAAFQFRFPVVGTTGRTAVQATAIDTVNVRGSAKNLTLSRGLQPFQTDASGLKYLNKGTFGGNADALGIDVNGKIGRLNFKRGLGDPNGVNTKDPEDSTSESGETGDLPATQYGIPVGSTGYPASGYLVPRSRPSTFTCSGSSRPTCRFRPRRTRCSFSRRIKAFRCMSRVQGSH